jgi:REP element-mobilizing transposase RayT
MHTKSGSYYQKRRKLPHEIPSWVDPSQEIYFITINCLNRGHNQLCQLHIAEALLESCRYRHHSGAWHTYLFLLMPDHLHALLSFPLDGPGIQPTITAWKRWTCRQNGIVWQRDYFEHRLRGEDALDEKASYISNNPVRKGLVEKPEDWKWVVRGEA